MSAVTKDQVLEYLDGLTVLQVSELVKELEERWGVSAAAPVAMAAMPAAGGEAAADEQTEFDVIMTSYGQSKIGVIKIVRGITGLGLKEAKALVDAVPKAVKEGVSKDEADDIQKQLEEAGAVIEVK